MTRSMIRWTLAACMALTAFGAVAVLDVGSTTAHAEPSASQFAGSWSGTWAHVEDDDVGAADWTISDAGRITGTAYSIPDNFGGAIVGHVGADGKLAVIAAAGYPHQGTAVIDSNGRLVVSATGMGSFAVSFVAIFERN